MNQIEYVQNFDNRNYCLDCLGNKKIKIQKNLSFSVLWMIHDGKKGEGRLALYLKNLSQEKK